MPLNFIRFQVKNTPHPAFWSKLYFGNQSIVDSEYSALFQKYKQEYSTCYNSNGVDNNDVEF
mgnify:CR=1 FL=1